MRKTSPIGDVIIELSEIDSTNNYAMKLLNEGMAEAGLCIKADKQTQGKGQLGNIWISEESKNLLFSVILDTEDFVIEKQFYLNAMACISVADLLMNHFEIREISIKWPNDIYAGNKKIAGILIENNIRGNSWTNAVVGIGLNINQTVFPDLNRATSLINETGKAEKVNHVMKLLIKYLNKNYLLLQKDEEQLFKLYNSLLFKIGSKVLYKKKHEILEGILLGVSKMGLLELKTGNLIKGYKHKEVELIIS